MPVVVATAVTARRPPRRDAARPTVARTRQPAGIAPPSLAAAPEAFVVRLVRPPRRLPPLAVVRAAAYPPPQRYVRPPQPVVCRVRPPRRRAAAPILTGADPNNNRRAPAVVLPVRPPRRPVRPTNASALIRRGPGAAASGGIGATPSPLILAAGKARKPARPMLNSLADVGARPIVVPGRTVLVVPRIARRSAPRPPTIVTTEWAGKLTPPVLRPVRLSRRPTRIVVPIVAATGIVTPYKGPTPRPVVLRRTARILTPPRIIVPAIRYPLASPVLRLPTPRVRVVRPRLPVHGWLSRPTIGTLGVPAAPEQQPPTDLVQAAIAWLRAVPISGIDETAVPRYYADVAAVGTGLPYVAFDEQDETDTRESDNTFTSDGTIIVGIAGRSKIEARLLAQRVHLALEDAPLYFTDGTLIHFRRTARRFTPVRETGPAANQVIYKRFLEFRSIIERQK